MTRNARIAGRYRLVEPAGRGRAGRVWAARDERSGQSVAVRLLTRGAEDPRRVAHFRASALAAARLRHPHVVRVLDEGQDPALGPFIVSEWVDGAPLSHWVGLRLPWGFLRAVLLQVCDALAYVHARGLVHLDLRPATVLVESRADGPFVRVADVGCARTDDGYGDRALGARATLEQRGSLRYLAPEVAEAPPWQVGAWSDLYGLGLMLWELLCGDLPYGDLKGIPLLLERASKPAPPLPAGVAPGHEAALRELMARLLARDPQDRPRNAAQVHHTLAAMPGAVSWVEPPPRRRVAQPAFEAARAPAGGFPLLALSAEPLVGREEALRAVWSAAEKVVAGHGSRVVVVEGERATGKTHLLRVVAEHAERLGTARVWWASFAPEAPPGSGLVAALEDLLRATDTDAEGVRARAAALPLLLGADGEGLEEVLPALLRPDPTPFARPGNEPDPGADVGGVGSAHMIAGASLELLRRVAHNEAVLLCLDDVDHATEPEGADLIERILAAPDLPVCVLVATRGGGLPRSLPADRAVRVTLGPLTPDAIRAYVRGRAGLAPAAEDAVVEAVGRQPALMRAIVDHLLDGGLVETPEGHVPAPGVLLPESFDEVVRARVAALPSEGPDALVPDVVQGLAFARTPLAPPVVRALVEVDPHRPFDRALAAAERARLVERRPLGGWHFIDHEVAAWLRRRAESRAASWHRRWLKALEAMEAVGRGRLGLERAAHAEALGDLPVAVRALLEAASWALGPGQQALERGLRGAERAHALARASGDRLRAARACRLKAELLRQAGRRTAAVDAVADAEALLDEAATTLHHGGRVEHGWCALTRGWLALDAAAPDEAERLFAAARTDFEAANDAGGVLWTYIGQGYVAGGRGHHRTARTLAREADEGFEALGAPRGRLAARFLRARAAELAGDVETAERRYARLQALADERRWLLEGVTLRLPRVHLALRAARAHDALRLLDEARLVCDAVRLVRLREWIDAVRPAALAAAGEAAAARAALAAPVLPNPRLCASAARAVEAGADQPNTRLEPGLARALTAWAEQLRIAAS